MLLNLTPQRLQAQIEDLRPIAKHHYDAGQANHDAWRLALEQANATSTSRSAHPTDDITQALIRHVAWNPSTCDIERLFGKAYCSSSLARGDVDEGRLNDEAQCLGSTADVRGDAELCANAQHVWARAFSQVRRVTDKPRMDTGKHKAADEGSMASFLKRRRLQVTTGASEVDAARAAEPDGRAVGVGGWEESHAREMQFQSMKRRTRLMETMTEGAALPHEYDADVVREWEHLTVEDAKRDKAYAQRQRRAATALARPTMPNLAGQKYFTTVPAGDETPVARGCRRLGLGRVEDVYMSDVVIVANVTNPGAALLWPIMLGGKFVCSSEFIASRGAKGTAIKYAAATQIARQVFVSPLFAARHHDRAVDVLWHTRARAGSLSKWVLAPDRATFMRNALRANAAKKPTTVVAFLAKAEIEKAENRIIKLRLTAEDAFERLSQVSRMCCCAQYFVFCLLSAGVLHCALARATPVPGGPATFLLRHVRGLTVSPWNWG